jgi:hypothetical protein
LDAGIDLATEYSCRNGPDKCPNEQGVMHDDAKKDVSPEMSSFFLLVSMQLPNLGVSTA